MNILSTKLNVLKNNYKFEFGTRKFEKKIHILATEKSSIVYTRVIDS